MNTPQGPSTLLLNPDGTGEFNGKELRWTFRQNVLTLSFEGGSTVMYKASLTSNSLTVSGADLKAPMTFKRSGSAEGPESAQAGTASEPGAGLGAIAGGAAATSSGPAGTWRVQNPSGTFTLVLNPDGSGQFNNDNIRWQFNRGILTLTWENGTTFMYNATLTANSLNVSGANLRAPINFQRVEGGVAPAGLSAGSGAARKSPASAASGPVGSWETPGPSGPVRLVLNPDGSGQFGSGNIRWAFNQNVLSVTGPNGNTIMYNASLGPDSMTLTGGGLESPVTFRRSGAEPEEASGDVGAGSARGRGGLVGSWQGEKGTLQLNADGSAIFNGTNVRYSAEGGVLTLVGSDGQFPLPYRLSGNTLTLTIQGQMVNFTRMSGGGARGGMATGAGSHPPEMFGKWCYYSGSNTGQIMSGREECVTLNPNGTYSYYGASDSTNQYGGTASQSSDSGTWSVNGSTVTVNSQKQGQRVYHLEKRNTNTNNTNDPMICLDGRCFVTYGPKPPWR